MPFPTLPRDPKSYGFLGLIVSLAFYLSTGMNDHASFLAGIVYGVIIVAVARPSHIVT